MADIEKVELKNTKEIDLPKLDIKQYVGKKVEIAEVDEMRGEYGYFIIVRTQPVDTILNKDGEKIELKASRNFGLQEDSDGNIGWGKDTNLGFFLEKMGVKHYNDLVGCEVVIQTQENHKTKKEYLSFN